MNPTPIVIFGAARSNGNTRKAVDMAFGDRPYEFVDLATLDITEYDYAGGNKGDDYIPLMERVLQHDLIVLATPTYWYSLSGRMKIFLDRLTDCIYVRSDLGRALAGKRLMVITSQGAAPRAIGFESPFIQTATYMKMIYHGCWYYHTGKDPLLLADNAVGLAGFQAKLDAAVQELNA